MQMRLNNVRGGDWTLTNEHADSGISDPAELLARHGLPFTVASLHHRSETTSRTFEGRMKRAEAHWLRQTGNLPVECPILRGLAVEPSRVKRWASSYVEF